jgi:hypothetical protein
MNLDAAVSISCSTLQKKTGIYLAKFKKTDNVSMMIPENLSSAQDANSSNGMVESGASLYIKSGDTVFASFLIA